jgi:hypothetical protein
MRARSDDHPKRSGPQHMREARRAGRLGLSDGVTVAMALSTMDMMSLRNEPKRARLRLGSHDP